jgi:fucose permease
MTAIAAVGIFDGALGVAWPSMRATFDQPLAALGLVILAYTGGYFASSSAGGWLLERIGTGRAMVGVAASGAAGIALFALAPAWWVVLVGAVVIGVSGGAADLTLNHELARHHSMRALAFLHAAWGTGAAASPLVVSSLVAGGRSWRLAFLPVVLIQAVLVLRFVALRDDWGAAPRREREPVEGAEPLDRVGLVLAALLFLTYVGVEAAAGQWGFTLLTEGRDVPARTAGAWMSGYWLALTGGRVALGIAGDRWDPDRLLTVSITVALASTVVLWADPAGAGLVALVPLGLALSTVFPVLVSVTPARLGAHRAARVLGIQIAASAVGGVAVPGVLGLGAQAWGASSLAWMTVTVAVALTGLHAAALGRRRPTPA